MIEKLVNCTPFIFTLDDAKKWLKEAKKKDGRHDDHPSTRFFILDGVEFGIDKQSVKSAMRVGVSKPMVNLYTIWEA